MADESFEVEFRTSGQSDMVAAFESLKLKELEAKNEASRLGTELRKLQQSGTATAQQIEETSRSLVRAQAAAQGYGTQARALTATQATGAQATQAFGQRLGQVGTALGQVGAVAGRISPQMGQLGQVLGQVGGATGALSGAMGPLGVAMAGATVAVGLMSIAHDRAEVAARAQAEAVAQLTADHATLEGRIRATIEQQVRLNRIMSGQGGAVETMAESQAARNRVELLQRALQGQAAAIRALRETGTTGETNANAGGPEGFTRLAVMAAERVGLAPEGSSGPQLTEGERRIVEGQLRRAVGRVSELAAIGQRVAEEETAEAARIIERAEVAASRRRGGGGQDAARRAAEEEAAQQRSLQESISYAQQRADAEAAANQAIIDARTATTQFLNQLDDEHINRVLANRDRVREKELAHAEQQQAALLAKAENTKAQNEELAGITNAAWTSVGSSMQSFLGEAFAFIQKGNEATGEGFLRLLDGFLEATAVEYTIKAVAETGNAIAAFASYRYDQGAQHLAAAGTYAAVAALTGVAGAAINVPSAAASQPTQVQPNQPLGAGGGGNITQNIYAQQAVWTERERAEIMASSFREARRSGGSGAARF